MTRPSQQVDPDCANSMTALMPVLPTTSKRYIKQHKKREEKEQELIEEVMSGWGGDYDEPAVEEKSRMRYEGTLMNPEAIQVPKRIKTTHQDVVKDIENSWERGRREYR
ncbi:hypothetical protein VTP01DRAFT_1357 [Rhizomucor pusillus]|uniref:uncharacterized protein n=1 Tax=Rhizomucor pusillus TaxID=4840 RepID=UPI0037428E7E